MATEWIKNMNEMYANNPYTNDKRVTIDYSANTNAIYITVYEDTVTIKNADCINEYKLMIEYIEIINTLYKATL